MSRIGRKPIAIPEGVQVDILGNTVKVKGPKGELNQLYLLEIRYLLITARSRLNDRLTIKTPCLHGLTRTLISNMITGVTNGYAKEVGD